MTDITETEIERLAELSIQSEKAGDHEMQTCLSVIIPFFNVLGYNHEKRELIAEYDADIGDKKNKKVDYALKQKNDDRLPIILVEAKPIGVPLAKHQDQLDKYFRNQDAGKEAKVTILTNGIDFWFFTDLDAINKMDKEPFFEFNLQEDKSNKQKIDILNKFCRTNFNLSEIKKIAQNLKIEKKVRNTFSNMQGVKYDEDVIDEVIRIAIAEKLQDFNTKSMRALANEILEGESQSIKPKTEASKQEPATSSKKQTKRSSRESEFYLKYWQGLINYLNDCRDLQFNIPQNTTANHEITFAMGKSKVTLYAMIKKDAISVELYIGRKDFYDSLYEKRTEIQNRFQCEFKWHEAKPNKRTSRVVMLKKVKPEDINDREKQFKWLKDTLEIFYKAFQERIDKL